MTVDQFDDAEVLNDERIRLYRLKLCQRMDELRQIRLTNETVQSDIDGNVVGVAMVDHRPDFIEVKFF